MSYFQALIKFQIAKKIEIVSNNKVKAETLELVYATESPEVYRTFELMWEHAKSLKPSVKFDPLGVFEKLAD